MKGLIGLSVVISAIYNFILWGILNENKTSTGFHEDSIQKKEIEYELGINDIWVSGKYFTFSSFRSGSLSMYHRIVFNFYFWILCGINLWMSEWSTENYKITVMTVFTVLYIVHVIVLRPYRSMSTNLLYFLCLLGFMMQLIFIRCVAVGYQQPIFIDQYFMQLTSILNGFIWFLIGLWLLFCIIAKIRWPIDKEAVYKLTDGQDLAIYYIKVARAFSEEVHDRKCFTPKDSQMINAHLDNLTLQFNNFRGSQPLIMDALLETIDSLRLMQKNYDDEADLFNFDYKKDLLDRAVERERHFVLKQFMPDPDALDEEEPDITVMESSKLLGVATLKRVVETNKD